MHFVCSHTVCLKILARPSFSYYLKYMARDMGNLWDMYVVSSTDWICVCQGFGFGFGFFPGSGSGLEKTLDSDPAHDCPERLDSDPINIRVDHKAR